jgi:hypothetical protein
MMILEPFASYFLNNGAVGKFGHAKSGLYGTNGSQEQLFDKAHFRLVNGKVEVEMADTNIIVLNGFKLGHGFKDYFEANGGVKFFGLPLSEEFTNPKTGLTQQCFERYCLEYDPKADPDWQVRGKDIGRFYLDNRGLETAKA